MGLADNKTSEFKIKRILKTWVFFMDKIMVPFSVKASALLKSDSLVKKRPKRSPSDKTAIELRYFFSSRELDGDRLVWSSEAFEISFLVLGTIIDWALFCLIVMYLQGLCSFKGILLLGVPHWSLLLKVRLFMGLSKTLFKLFFLMLKSFLIFS